MKIETDTHNIFYDKINHSIIFQGSLRLNGTEDYTSILDLLNNIVEEEPPKIVLNVKELKFLNSSGISMLSKFVINVRKSKNIQMVVIGAKDIPWQGKSLKNLQRLMPTLTIELV
ncbi:MAG: STAS domain-containing protein [Pleurocapsa sp.]